MAPEIAPHMVADFNLIPAFHFLQGAATVADQFARSFQDHRPQAVTVFLIALNVLRNPCFNALPVKSRRIILHGHRITQHLLNFVRILRNKFPQKQTPGRQDHTLPHKSARGSSACSLCNSCHSSRAFISWASGTIILISTISSPRLSVRVAEGTPFSRRRSFCPLCVPGGILSWDRPSMVGTSIFAPSADSHAATGTVT